jgi:hypothetical protein
MIEDFLTITIRKPAMFRRNMGHSKVESRRFRAESRFAALWTKFEKGACVRLPCRAPTRAKTPGIVRFSWASATYGRSGYPHQRLSLSVLDKAIPRIIAQKSGKSKLLVWKVGVAERPA